MGVTIEGLLLFSIFAWMSSAVLVIFFATGMVLGFVIEKLQKMTSFRFISYNLHQ